MLEFVEYPPTVSRVKQVMFLKVTFSQNFGEMPLINVLYDRQYRSAEALGYKGGDPTHLGLTHHHEWVHQVHARHLQWRAWPIVVKFCHPTRDKNALSLSLTLPSTL